MDNGGNLLNRKKKTGGSGTSFDANKEEFYRPNPKTHSLPPSPTTSLRDYQKVLLQWGASAVRTLEVSCLVLPNFGTRSLRMTSFPNNLTTYYTFEMQDMVDTTLTS